MQSMADIEKVLEKYNLELKVLTKGLELDRKYRQKEDSWQRRIILGFFGGIALFLTSVYSSDFYKDHMNPFRNFPAVSSYNSIVSSLENAYEAKNSKSKELKLRYTTDNMQKYLKEFEESDKMGSASLDGVIGELESEAKRAMNYPTVKGYVSSNKNFLLYRTLPGAGAGAVLTFASFICGCSIGGFYYRKKRKELEAFKKTVYSKQ